MAAKIRPPRVAKCLSCRKDFLQHRICGACILKLDPTRPNGLSMQDRAARARASLSALVDALNEFRNSDMEAWAELTNESPEGGLIAQWLLNAENTLVLLDTNPPASACNCLCHIIGPLGAESCPATCSNYGRKLDGCHRCGCPGTKCLIGECNDPHVQRDERRKSRSKTKAPNPSNASEPAQEPPAGGDKKA